MKPPWAIWSLTVPEPVETPGRIRYTGSRHYPLLGSRGYSGHETRNDAEIPMDVAGKETRQVEPLQATAGVCSRGSAAAAENTPAEEAISRWEQIARRAEAIYERDLRPKVEDRHKGEFLVLDVETGDFEIDENHLAAAKRLRARLPKAQLYALRIGYPAAYHLGGHVVRQQR